MSPATQPTIARVAFLTLAAAASLVRRGGAKPVRFLAASDITANEIESYLATELARGRSRADNLRQLEEALQPMYRALPKDRFGRLEHSTVRYALHRLLVQRHGWYVKGLEPAGEARNVSAASSSMKEWVPSHLQSILEHRLGRAGLDLGELAVLAATLEDAARREAASRLESVYHALALLESATLGEEQARDVIDLYALAYIKGGKLELHDAQHAKDRLSSWRSGMSYRVKEQFFRNVQGNVTTKANASAGALDFSIVLSVAEEIGKQYANYDARNCRELKSALLSIEGAPGRVDLAAFYAKSLSGYVIFQFNEKVDFLRDLGALDESAPQWPKVIIPNYVNSRPQCLESSAVYAVCCRDECEDLLGALERVVAAPEASPERLVDLVRDLSSSSVEAPRDISPVLVERLRRVADINDGRVPLHGRLFAQWMHHAFPRECPFPHEAGTTHPSTPDEWLRETGHTSTEASEEEMVCHISGSCAGGAGVYDANGDKPPNVQEIAVGGAQAVLAEARNATRTNMSSTVVSSKDIPWTDAEELLTAALPTKEVGVSPHVAVGCVMLIVLLGFAKSLLSRKAGSVSTGRKSSMETFTFSERFERSAFV